MSRRWRGARSALPGRRWDAPSAAVVVCGITVREQVDSGVGSPTDTLTLTATAAQVGDTIVAISLDDFHTLAGVLDPTGTAVSSWGTPKFTLDGGTDDGHAKVWVGTVTTAGGTVIFDWTNTDHERYGGIWVLAGTVEFDTAAGTDADAASTSHVAPSVNPSIGNNNGLLICVWATAAGVNSLVTNYTIPAQMTPGTERDVDTFLTIKAGWECLTSDQATGTRTATAADSREYIALSVLMKTAAPAAAAYVPTFLQPIRPSKPSIPRRSQFFHVPPIEAAQPPPPWTPTPVGARSRWCVASSRRSRFFDPPWPFIEPPPPESPPHWLRQAGRPWPIPAIRRGQTWNPPWPFVEPPPPPWIPTQVGTRSRWCPAPARRGHRWDAPPAEPPPAPSPWTVTRVGHRAEWNPPKPRGTQWSPPWPFVEPAPPQVPPAFQQQRPTRRFHSRRGRVFSPPSLTPWVPIHQHTRPRRCTIIRRGRFHEPPWPTFEPPAPSEYIPVFIHRPRPHNAVVRPRRWSPPWPFVEPPMVAQPGRGKVTQLSRSTVTQPTRSTVTRPKRSEVRLR